MPGQKIPSTELLEDLCIRFILNVPAEEIETFERLLFLVEQAHWFYEDVSVERDTQLKSLTLRDFTSLIFQKVPGLEAYQGFLTDILKSWQQYKQTVPVNGAMLLDPSLDKVLLVRGWKTGAGWGFPRGKVAKNEGDLDCAVREVKEETGYDITDLVAPDDVAEVNVGGQRSRLYIVAGVPEDTIFAPQVKKEIGALAWHLVSELPGAKEEANQVYMSDTGGRHRFFMVWPYIKQLRRWIKNKRKQQQGQGAKRQQQQQQQSRAAADAASRSAMMHHSVSAPVILAHESHQAALAASREMPGSCLLNFKFDRKAIAQALDSAL